MAPRKTKAPAKRNNIKIKGKVNGRKRDAKAVKKVEPAEKPLTNLRWLNKVVAPGSVKKCEALPIWFKKGSYKAKMASDANVSEYEEYPRQEEEEKSSVGSVASDGSEECNCSHSKYSENNKGGILKMNTSENSLVAKYIRSGMNQVASFIVESAIRFGEQHGVVVPDKDTPNLYEVTPPDSRFADKCRKIRFKVPEEASNYEEKKKLIWENYAKNIQKTGKRAPTPMPDWTASGPTKSSSWESTADSLEEILPILEKLKEGGDIVTSDLDLDKLDQEGQDREWRRDRERDRERDRDRERERSRPSDRGKERLREQIRTLKKKYKNLGLVAEKDSEDNALDLNERSRWKKCRRDSLELGRQRMRANSIRKRESSTPPTY